VTSSRPPDMMCRILAPGCTLTCPRGVSVASREVAVASNGGVGPRFPSLGAHPKIKDVIYEALREWIVFGEATPGDRLVEADLAARFGVSKTPVREALLTLQAEGLVTLRPHRGAEVSRLSAEEWRDLIFLRDVLEVGALEAIMASMTAEHFEAAEGCLAEMEAAFGAGDYRRYRQAQRRLHATILGAPGYPSLPEAAVQLNDRFDRYGRLLAMNRKRLALIRKGDTTAYARLIRGRHAEATAVIAADHALGESDPSATPPA
jgi:DNA-binding GntR family transcriptional regulator